MREAVPGMLLLRQPTSAAPPSAHWRRLVAHELTHVAQIELAGGEAAAPRWLGEGMADWVAYGVLARTGAGGVLDAHRDLARDATCAAIRAGTLDVEALGVPSRFIARALEQGALPTYRVAFFLVDDLVRTVGFDALVEYFGLFRASRDADAHFATAFGMPAADFEHAAVARASAACAFMQPATS